MTGAIYRSPPQRCPACAYVFDSHSSTQGNEPRPPRAEDLSVCFGCAALLRYVRLAQGKGLVLAILSPADYAALTFEERRTLDMLRQRILRRHN
jgi:hypothetical protein